MISFQKYKERIGGAKRIWLFLFAVFPIVIYVTSDFTLLHAFKLSTVILLIYGGFCWILMEDDL